MIDTLRLKVNIDALTYKKLKEAGLNINHFTNKKGYEKTRLTDQIYLQDLENGFRVEVNSSNVEWKMFLEFSVPKLYFGHNLFLFYPDGLPEVLFKIMDGLNKHFDIDLPNFSEWVVQRLDLCTVWKLSSDEIAMEFLQSFRNYEYPRKKVSVHDTTLSYGGSNGQVKFYLKHPEFLVNDHKQISQFRKKYADNLENFSVGCLRFETEMKKTKLKTAFHLEDKEELLVDGILNEDLLRGILIEELQKWFKDLNLRIMTDHQNYGRLKEQFGDKKAIELFQFYVTYLQSPHTKTILKKGYDKSTINRKLQLLAKAGVGLRGTLDLPFDLTVPSTLNPNQNNKDVPNLSTSEPLPDQQLNLPLSRPPME